MRFKNYAQRAQDTFDCNVSSTVKNALLKQVACDEEIDGVAGEAQVTGARDGPSRKVQIDVRSTKMTPRFNHELWLFRSAASTTFRDPRQLAFGRPQHLKNHGS
jgi:hypothetical protein